MLGLENVKPINDIQFIKHFLESPIFSNLQKGWYIKKLKEGLSY